MNDDLILELEQDDDLVLESYIPGQVVGTSDYEELENKPQFNDVTIIGNQTLADFFPDGIVIDCGSAEEDDE